MRMRFAAALPVGIFVALGVASFPASASDTPIAAQSATDTWSPADVTIGVGDSVTWSNDGGFHNVCVQKPGTSGSTCDEFRNGNPSADWSHYTNSHTFTTAGTYRFFCEVHATLGMTGTITVATGSGTSTTAPENTQTQTQAQTQTTPVATDTTAPSFTAKPKRRASRRSLVLEVGSSEDATLKATVFRRPPRGRSFSRVGEASLKVKQGGNVVSLPRTSGGSLRSGAYRVTLQLVDAAGNKSATRTLRFKLA